MFNLILNDSYFQKIVLGIIILGFVSGAVGVIVTLRKQALIGDALSHAALPGVVIAFMLFNTRNLWLLLLGALVASLLSMFLINTITKYTKIKFDASMALILSAFFGLGNVLLNFLTGSNQAGLSKFIFGEAATMLQADVNLIMIVSLLVLAIVIFSWKHIKLYIFDKNYYASLGFNQTIINTLITLVTVLVVVISIRAIGVVLMSALLIAPAVSARLWTNRLNRNFIIAGIFGGLSGLIGTYASFTIKGLPTGPAVVVSLSIVLLLSLLFSPKKGFIAKYINNLKYKNLIIKYHDLVHLYQYNELDTSNSESINNYLSNSLIILENNEYKLTPKGMMLVNNIIKGENIWA